MFMRLLFFVTKFLPNGETHSPKEVESPLSVLLLHVSLRFTRLFRCELNEESYGEKRASLLANWSVDVCTVSRLGRFVLFCEEQSLFTIIISSGYGRSLAPLLEMFHRRREELARELELCGLAPFSFTTFRFSKRANRHIIGSQNDLIYLLRGYLEGTAPPLEGDRLRKVEDSLNQTPMLGLAQQRYAKSHRIFANSRGVKDFRRFRNSQDGTCFSRSVLGA